MKKQTIGSLIFIPGANGGRYPHCNSLFIDDEMKVIIDPGSDEPALKNLARRKGVDIIIASHCHEDHVSFNYLFPEARLYVHREETKCYQSLSTLLDFYGLQGTEFEETWRNIIIESFHYKERIPALEFRGGDTLNFGTTRMEIIHTPGHSIGHCSFYFPDEKVLFLGDLDLTRFGPWYGDRVSNIDDTIESVHKLLSIPAEIFITSHEVGIVKDDISELAERYLQVIYTREADLLTFLEKPRSLEDITAQWIIYKRPREPRWFFEFGERAMITKHLERLLKKGAIRHEGGTYHLT